LAKIGVPAQQEQGFAIEFLYWNNLGLGSDALKLVREKFENLSAEFTLWEDVTRSTDYD